MNVELRHMRYFVGRGQLSLADVAGLRWIAASPATDGCDPMSWRDAWLLVSRPGGDQPVTGGDARTIEEMRELIAAGRGIGLCPASAEQFNPRPGVTFVASKDAPSAAICVAWRTGDQRAEVRSFVVVAIFGPGYGRTPTLNADTATARTCSGPGQVRSVSDIPFAGQARAGH